MKKIVAAFWCTLLLSALPMAAQPDAPPSAVSAAPAAHALPVTADVATDLKLQQQTLEFFKERLQTQDERIVDLGLMIGFFGILITVVVLLFSFRSTKEAVLAAKNEAREEIEQRSEEYIKAVLQPKVEKALKDIMEAAGKRLDDLEKAVIDKLASIPLDKNKPLTPEQNQELEKAAKNLESIPPKEYRSSDWHLLGRQAFEQGKYEIAVGYVSKAADIAESPMDRANALTNKGLILDVLQRREEAIAVYDEVVKRYGEAPEEALREQVATALLNKSITLGQLQRRDEAIAVCDEVVKRYGEAPEAALRGHVAMAMLAKSIALDELQRRDEAIAICDEIVKRYGDASDATPREQAALALSRRNLIQLNTPD